MLVNACIVNVEVMCGDRWVQLVKVYVCRKKICRLRATPRMNLALNISISKYQPRTTYYYLLLLSSYSYKVQVQARYKNPNSPQPDIY
jgi:hypothetical protein